MPFVVVLEPLLERMNQSGIPFRCMTDYLSLIEDSWQTGEVIRISKKNEIGGLLVQALDGFIGDRSGYAQSQRLAFATNRETRHMVKCSNLLTTDFHRVDPVKGQSLARLLCDHAGEDLSVIAEEKAFDGFKVIPEYESGVSL